VCTLVIILQRNDWLGTEDEAISEASNDTANCWPYPVYVVASPVIGHCSRTKASSWVHGSTRGVEPTGEQGSGVPEAQGGIYISQTGEDWHAQRTQ